MKREMPKASPSLSDQKSVVNRQYLVSVSVQHEDIVSGYTKGSHSHMRMAP